LPSPQDLAQRKVGRTVGASFIAVENDMLLASTHEQIPCTYAQVGHEILATDHGLHLSPVSMAAVCSYHMAAYPGRRRTVSSRHPRAQCGLHPEAAVLLSKCLL